MRQSVNESSGNTASVTLTGTVEKIIKSPFPGQNDKAEISVEDADHLYREIRIENELQNENGERVELRPGAEVDITVKAPEESTTPKH